MTVFKIMDKLLMTVEDEGVKKLCTNFNKTFELGTIVIGPCLLKFMVLH